MRLASSLSLLLCSSPILMKESFELARGGARFGTTEAIEKCLSTFLRGADLSVTAPSTVEQVLHAPPFATGRHQDLRVQRAVQCATGAAGSDELASTLGASGGFGGAPKQELGVPSEAPTRFWRIAEAGFFAVSRRRAPQAFSAS